MGNPLPTIPSEMLEPHLSKFFGLIVGMIGAEREFPSVEKWREWHNMLKGVHYFVIGTDATHANIAMGNELAKIDPFWSGVREGDRLLGGFEESKAREVWQICREISENPPEDA